MEKKKFEANVKVMETKYNDDLEILSYVPISDQMDSARKIVERSVVVSEDGNHATESVWAEVFIVYEIARLYFNLDIPSVETAELEEIKKVFDWACSNNVYSPYSCSDVWDNFEELTRNMINSVIDSYNKKHSLGAKIAGLLDGLLGEDVDEALAKSTEALGIMQEALEALKEKKDKQPEDKSTMVSNGMVLNFAKKK